MSRCCSSLPPCKRKIRMRLKALGSLSLLVTGIALACSSDNGVDPDDGPGDAGSGQTGGVGQEGGTGGSAPGSGGSSGTSATGGSSSAGEGGDPSVGGSSAGTPAVA